MEEAIDAFSAAISLFPNDTTALFYRGCCYIELDEDQKAIDDFSEVIELDPAEQFANVNRAIVHFDLEHYSLAWGDVLKAIDLGPDYSVAYYLRGNIYLLYGELNRAVRDYEVALSLDSELREARVNRMSAYRASKIWWVFGREGRCLGNIFTKGKAPPSAQIGRGDDNPHFENMVASVQPLGKGRVDFENSVIFLDVELEKWVPLSLNAYTVIRCSLWVDYSTLDRYSILCFRNKHYYNKPIPQRTSFKKY